MREKRDLQTRPIFQRPADSVMELNNVTITFSYPESSDNISYERTDNIERFQTERRRHPRPYVDIRIKLIPTHE